MDPGLACFFIPHGLGLGGHWAWPQPFPLLFLRQTAPGADTASCESSGGSAPPRLGGWAGRGTMDSGPPWIMPVGVPGILGCDGTRGDLLGMECKGGKDGDQIRVGTRT